jgi:peptidoglycan hydrolase CwlO-like protein
MSEETILEAIASLRRELIGDLGTLGGQVGALEGQIGALDRKVGALDAKVGSLDTKVGALEGRMTTMEGKITTLRVDLMARLDRHEDALSAIRDDIAVSMGRADRAQDAAENTREELRALGDQVNAMYRKMKHTEARIDKLEGHA